MAKIEIYTTVTCPFCSRVKSLFDAKEVSYINHNMTGNAPERAKMTERAGGVTSVPQVFIDDKHFGGCDDIYALDGQGKLDELIK